MAVVSCIKRPSGVLTGIWSEGLLDYWIWIPRSCSVSKRISVPLDVLAMTLSWQLQIMAPCDHSSCMKEVWTWAMARHQWLPAGQSPSAKLLLCSPYGLQAPFGSRPLLIRQCTQLSEPKNVAIMHTYYLLYSVPPLNYSSNLHPNDWNLIFKKSPMLCRKLVMHSQCYGSMDCRQEIRSVAIHSQCPSWWASPIILQVCFPLLLGIAPAMKA